MRGRRSSWKPTPEEQQTIMENDMRLINANDIPWWLGCNDDGRTIVYARATDVDAMPAIDAVPVVRCKDCKHWKPIDEHIPHMECNIFCGAYEHGYPTNADDFCSYGERKEQ